jgi:hypothetical protein
MTRTYLGEAARRLASVLELEGPVSPEFATGERIVPVVLVGSGLAPGMSQFRGRRFAGALQVAAANHGGLRADRSLQIDRVLVGSATAGVLSIRYVGPTDGPGTVMGTGTMPLLEGNQGEIAPGNFAAVADANVPASVVTLAQVDVAANGILEMEHAFMLPAGAILLSRQSAAAVHRLSLWGRIW